ncbi:PIN domain-containing protein [Candidatus Saccharibacteria bacterium]|nr:PIN domain-containing protein [Candidatus Saccharibacteria bacterium]
MELNSKYASIDTNIILLFTMNDNPLKRQRALKLLLDGREYYVDSVAIMETVYVMTKNNFDRRTIVEDTKDFLSNTMIHYDKKMFDEVFEKFISHPSLSLEDCVLDYQAKKENRLPLYTFDKKFANQAETATLVK